MAGRPFAVGSRNVNRRIGAFGLTEVFRKSNAVCEVLFKRRSALSLVHGQTEIHPVEGLLIVQGYSDKEKL